MSRILPKEKQTAYQRWELASFDDESSQPAPTPVNHELHPEKLAAMRQQAHQEGYTAGLENGLEEGRQKGWEEGLAEGRAEAAEEIARFEKIARKFQEDLAHADEVIAQDILDVSLDLAKAMLKTAFSIRPELILPIIQEAIHYLPSVQQPASLFLHPDDMPIVKQFMGDELSKTGWRILEDPHLERGGCRVETASNQIDATASTRWQRIMAALDKTNDWLTP